MKKLAKLFCLVGAVLASLGLFAEAEQDGKSVLLTSEIPSVGTVTLSCDRPSGWRFSLTPEKAEDGADVLRIAMTAERPEEPPVFTVAWFTSQHDTHHIWTSETPHYGFQYPPHLTAQSELSFWMPLYAFFDENDENRMTVAASESCRRVVFEAPFDEVTMRFYCSFTYFTVPEAPIAAYETCIRFDARPDFYAERIAAASEWMCRAAGISPQPSPDCAFDPLYSTWYTFHQQVSAELVEEELSIARDLGMKTVIVDDGWQIDLPLGNRQWGGYSLCGDWRAGRMFPDMAEHVKRAHQLGFKYMLWYSVPFVGEKSGCFDRFKGKYLPSTQNCYGGWVLDPRFPEVREYLIQTYERAVREWDLDGFKLDFIDRFALRAGVVDPAVAENFAGRDIKSIPLAVDRLLTDVMARLKAIKPDILIEFRQRYVGPCIRKFGNMIRAIDCPCAMTENRARTARLRLTSGRTAVHSDMIEWRSDETPETAARCMLNAMFSVIQCSVRLAKCSPEHLAVIRHWLAFSSQHRDALVRGVFRPYGPAQNYPLLEGESADERIFGVYQPDLTVRTRGLDRTVYILNGADADSVIVDFAEAAEVEVYDTFGAKTATQRVPAGLRRLSVPLSGYVKVCRSR